MNTSILPGIKSLIGLMLIFSAVTTYAQDEIKYRVEIITFQYLEATHTLDSKKSNEKYDEKFDAFLIEDYLPKSKFNINSHNRLWENISHTEMTILEDALKKLLLNDNYRVLSHNAWIQPLLNKQNAVAVPLNFSRYFAANSLHPTGDTELAPNIDGSIKIYGDYLLFADIDLKAILASPPKPIEQSFELGSSLFAPSLENDLNIENQDETQKIYQAYKLQEKRRIKLEETHYFDHPFIGAVIHVARHEVDQENRELTE